MRHRVLFQCFALTAALGLSGCTELDALRARDAAQQQQIDSLQKENKQFQDAYYQIKSTMDNELAGASQKTDQIQRDLEAARNLRSQKETELSNQLNTRQLELEAARNEMADQKKLDAAKIAQLSADLQSSTDETKAALDKLAASDDQLRREKDRADGLAQQQAKLTVDLKASQDVNAGLQKDLIDAKATAVAAQKQLDAQKAQLAAAQKQIDQQAAAAAAAQKQIDQQTADAAAAQKQIDALKADLESAQTASKDVETLKQKLAQAEKDLAAQKESAKQAEAKQADALKAARADAEKAAANAAAKSASDPELEKAAESFQAELAKLDDGAPAKTESVRVDAAGLHIVLPSDKLFKPGAIILSDDAAAMLDPAIKLIGSLPGRAVSVEGHTDDQPIADLPFADNWGLGFARADRVREALMTQGNVPPERLTALSRAQFAPLADQGTAEGRALDRRVEIVIAHKPR